MRTCIFSTESATVGFAPDAEVACNLHREEDGPATEDRSGVGEPKVVPQAPAEAQPLSESSSELGHMGRELCIQVQLPKCFGR